MLSPDSDPVSALGETYWDALLASEPLDRRNEQSRALFIGNIARACFKSAFPPIGLCSGCVDDLAMEFAHQFLDQVERKHWLDMWSSSEASGERKMTRFYRSSVTLPSITKLVGTRGFVMIVRELLNAIKSGLVLDFDDYILFLDKRVRRISAPLDVTELRMIRYLLDNRTFMSKALAASIGVTPEWVSRKISELQKRLVLRRFDRIPFSKVGIRMFNLFVDVDESGENLFKFFNDCPFLYSYQPVLTGKWDALAMLCVPDNITSMKLLGEFEGLLGKWGLVSSLREIVSSGAANCFDYYDVESKSWEIPWELLELHLRRIHEGGLAKVINRIDAPANRIRIQIDELDMRILNQIRLGNSSISKVRKVLGIGQERAAERVRRLRDEGLVETTWEVHNVGLNESVVVTSFNSEVGEGIAAWSLKLPRAVVSFDVSRNLTLVAQLPKGGAYGLTRSAAYLAHMVDVGILDEKVYGGWGFPIELWDAKRQGWKCPRQEIENWLENIR
jgi:DNA-binding Lrp family transcriptional regulator